MLTIPSDVPKNTQEEFKNNYKEITKNTERLMLFAADQKMEHLNKDFHGSFIHPDANHPRHIFNIASQCQIGALATHLGLIARYGQEYPDINFIVKLNGKTNLIDIDKKDPISNQLWTVEDVINFKKSSGLKIRGIGYTLYIGSQYEADMLHEAAQAIFKAHQNGLIAILWVYPRGNNINIKDLHEIIPGATGIANSLGADFVKIVPPSSWDLMDSDDILKTAVQAAGNTKVICSGGEAKLTEVFLKELYAQIHLGGTSGNATGRNIFQRSLADACAFTKAICAIVYDNKTAEEAIKIYEKTI